MNQPAGIPTIDVQEAAARRDGPDNPIVVDTGVLAEIGRAHV